MGSRTTARLAELDRELNRWILNPEKADRSNSSRKSIG
jgi:hypothetical protein